MKVVNFIALASILLVSVSIAGAEKTVMIHIDEYLIPKGDLHEFPVNGTDEATLQNLLDSAVNKGLMTYKADDANGITSIDGVDDVIWVIVGEGLNDLPQAEQLDYVPLDGQSIFFTARVWDAEEDDLVIVKMVEISIIPKPDPSKFPSHFYGFGSLDATLLEIMSNSENTNPPGHSKMTYEFMYGLFITSIDGKEAPEGYAWVVKVETGNGWETVNYPVNVYRPPYGAHIQFSLEKYLDDNQQYSAGTRAWYSNMIVVTATLFAVYIA